ncbi:MAG TPA: PilX N-terminal domain-containing pilus assembly protein [Woeseiaceae bacterium]|nr:PilX N-terminal domain-containing pilus assembly protein [Woeseiaceae bacterium]
MKTAIGRKQGGAALIVGLILLVVVTVLAISGMNTATTELAIARNDQNFENAFQAAETGLELALSRGFYQAVPIVDLGRQDIAETGYSVDTTIRFVNTTMVPPDHEAFSLGSGMAAYHFVATAQARSSRDAADDANDYDRDASALHTQGFYIIGPGAPSL